MTPHDRSAVVALASLAAMWPRRLRVILAHHPAQEALALLAAGRPLAAEVQRRGDSAVWSLLRRQAAAADPERLLADCHLLNIAVVTLLDHDYPVALRDDPDPPPVLFVRGTLRGLAARRVAIIGTRNATAAGRATAGQLGEQLADHGVTVISGLARGIDAAAHRGVRLARRAPPGAAVAVVGNGLDIPYPRQNTDLWTWVGEHGALISEWPPGTVPEAWRFPLRNRVIAALCERLIVVESRARGGSLITVRDALDRGIDVMAVPGSVRSRASEGTNSLINDGAGMVTCTDDVLVSLGLDHSRQSLAGEGEPEAAGGVESSVLQRCAERPSTIDMLAADLSIPISQIAVTLAALESSGVLIDSGGWFEASRSRLGATARAAAEAVRPGSLAT
jgi:DNA processing protein